MTANAPRRNPNSPSWRTAPRTLEAMPRLRTAVVNRNGFPPSKLYVYQGAGTAVKDGEDCRACGGKPVITSTDTVTVKHKPGCAVGERVRALRGATPKDGTDGKGSS